MKINQIIKTILLGAIVLFSVGCDQMDYNYSEYLEKEKVYSPKVNNLVAKQALREVTLLWENPPGDIAKHIYIDYQDSTITTETMIDSITLTGLEIKGYEISVYTIDAFNNLSVPETVIAFPNGEYDETEN